MTPALREALHATDVIRRVEQRLMEAGAFIELDQLRNLSMDEMDVLVLRETGAGDSVGECDTWIEAA